MRSRPKSSRAVWLCNYLWMLLHLCLAGSCFAEAIEVTLPLDGYYHPGRYMPVRLKAELSGYSNLKLAADGAMSTFVEFRDPIDLVLPWLKVDANPSKMSWNLDAGFSIKELPLTLRPLTQRQRLIAFTAPTERGAKRLAALLFPGDEQVLIQLNGVEAIPGSAAAWETVDLLLLDQNKATRLDEHRLAILIAGGVTVAVLAPRPPLRHWPWREMAVDEAGNRCWVLRHQAAGPQSAVYNEEVYRPVSSWRPGWPVVFRRSIAVMGIAFALLTIALTSWKPPLTILWLTGLTLFAVGGMCLFWKFQTPLSQQNGQVVVLDNSIVQIDDWLYQTSFRAMQSTVYWGDYTKPIFASPEHLRNADPTLMCFPNGDPAFLLNTVSNGRRTALLMRRVGPQGPAAHPRNPVTSPMLDMVRSLYVTPEVQVMGELASTPNLGTPYSDARIWPAVILERLYRLPSTQIDLHRDGGN